MAKEWKKTKIIYWSDELNDDFDEICLPRPSVPKNYKYCRTNPVSNFFSWILYHIIARPIIGLFLIFEGVKFKNKKALNRTKGKGAFIYSNHVSFSDVIKFQPFAKKRVNILGYSDSLSMPIVRNICHTLGYIPLPLVDDVDNIKKMEESFDFYINKKKQHIVIYPEAHIWPYYTKIRNFKSSSFIYPARVKAPVVPVVAVWRKSKIFKKPKQTIIFGNPIFPLDEYSDLDIWFDVEDSKRDSFIQNLVDELSKIGKIDSMMTKVSDVIYQSNIHLENTSEYLTLDLAAQNDSRDRDDTCFIKGSITEVPKIIFDRKNVISFKEPDKLDKELLNKAFEEKKNRILQYSRVTKYIKRNQYLECFMEYDKQILKPIVTIARIVYTPDLYDYELCHISRHMPKEIVEKIEKLYKVSSFDDIEKNITLALEMLDMFDKKNKLDFRYLIGYLLP